MTVRIAFQGGTHGHFLKYVLDRCSGLTPPIEELPFTDTGTSHNKHIKYSGLFEITHPHNWGWDDANDPHIVITLTSKDILYLQRIVYIRPGDRVVDLNNDIIKLGKDIADNESIKNLYGIKTENGVPHFILRDFCKLGFSDIKNHGFMSIDKIFRQQKLNNVHYFPVSAFWNQAKFFEEIKIIDKKFKLDITLDDGIVTVHQKFIDLQEQLKTQHRADGIISAIKEKRDIPIIDLDLIEEAYIYSWIETTHRNILAPFTNKFFKNTKEILDYIRWYPHFYHGMNPTLPKNIG